MVKSKTLDVQGERVELREGDVVFTRWNRIFPSAFIAALNAGMSHVAIVLEFGGKLYNVEATLSTAPFPEAHYLRNSRGQIVRNGVHAQLVDESYARAQHMWVLRPKAAYTRAQLDAMKATVMCMLDKSDGRVHNHTYERSFLSCEYLHALLGCAPYSHGRYMCAEAIAVILRAGGHWEGTTSVMPIHIRDRVEADAFRQVI